MRLLLAAAALLAGGLRADIADDVKARLESPPVLRGRFEQSKAIRGLRKPLRSSGSFVLARGKGVLWRTEKPWAHELRVGPAGLATRRGGKTVFELKAGEQPGVKVVSEVLAAVFAGDLPALRGTFEMQGSAKGAAWTVELKPKPGPAARAASSITLRGTRHVERMELNEPGGDRTEVAFSRVTGAQGLAKEEEASFAP